MKNVKLNVRAGVLGLGALLLFNSAWAGGFKAQIYELGSKHTEKLFSFEVKTEEKGDLTEQTAVYVDSQGEQVLYERSLLKGAEALEYHVEQKQTGESGDIKVKEGKIYFSTVSADGKKKEASESLKEPFVMSVSFNRFVHKNWDKLVSGQEIDIRYGVWYRRDTVGFSLKKMGEETKNGQSLIHIRMKPSSFIIAAIVDPIHMWYSKDGSQIIALKGRVAPKRKVGDHWKDLDAEVDYVYEP